MREEIRQRESTIRQLETDKVRLVAEQAASQASITTAHNDCQRWQARVNTLEEVQAQTTQTTAVNAAKVKALLRYL
jgi:hypothetical protein